VRCIFLTHRDDVADAHRYAAHFGSVRIIHERDAGGQPGAEIPIRGRDPVPMGRDFTVLPVPGHTAGSSVLLYRERYLFSGDHLAWDRREEQLRAFRWACWYSWPEQIESMKRLAEHRFEWVLPGHGYRVCLPEEQVREQMAALIARMPRQRR
jgi:glyoxylase-like metal-dependent hydrolase (beta-lactamase superfamily II)